MKTAAADRTVTAVGAALAAGAVIAGAYGQHGLSDQIGALELGWWKTAAQYQMWSALGLFVLGLAAPGWARVPAWILVAGTIVFSGTLYAMALGGPHWLGAVTPVGGLAIIAAWLLLAWNALRRG